MKYSRLTKLVKVGNFGLKKIQSKEFTIVGVGGLGTVVAEYLLRSGAQHIRIIDRDVVDDHNLQRQILYSEKDIGKLKTESAVKRLQEINSEANIIPIIQDLTHSNVQILQNGIIIDCTDNLGTKFLINDYAKKNKLHWIHGSCVETIGNVWAINPNGACLRCIYYEVKGLPTCADVGVLGPALGVVGSLQATKALQLALDINPGNEFERINVWSSEIEKFNVNPKKGCKTCKGEYEYLYGAKTLIEGCGVYRFGDSCYLKKDVMKTPGAVGHGGVVSSDNFTLLNDGVLLVKAESRSQARKKISEFLGD